MVFVKSIVLAFNLAYFELKATYIPIVTICQASSELK